MTSTIAQPVVLKTDGRGRVRTPETRREALLDEFERSGVPGSSLPRMRGEVSQLCQLGAAAQAAKD